MWATVPDVVGDHAATLARWDQWARPVIDLGFAPAFVAQDGCTVETIPEDAAAVFLGGSTGWKLGPVAEQIARSEVRPVHMGRVNTLRRLRLAADWGCDSVDGTFLAFGPDANLPSLLRWMREVNTQPTFTF
jgi:hypothetical protein